jgi:hypothetical protein
LAVVRVDLDEIPGNVVSVRVIPKRADDIVTLTGTDTDQLD